MCPCRFRLAIMKDGSVTTPVATGDRMTTLERVIPIVAKQLGRDEAESTAATDLEEAGYESLDVIETIFAVEEEFGIDVNFNANTDDASKLKTVGDLAAIVDETMARQGKA